MFGIKILSNSKEFTVENRKTQVKKNENTAHQNSVNAGKVIHRNSWS